MIFICQGSARKSRQSRSPISSSTSDRRHARDYSFDKWTNSGLTAGGPHVVSTKAMARSPYRMFDRYGDVYLVQENQPTEETFRQIERYAYLDLQNTGDDPQKYESPVLVRVYTTNTFDQQLNEILTTKKCLRA
ncbi:uncharacterized protein [Bemisia tabaci]|uniref:uncharacterized protein isoform X1 n=2 Tax=Bemisia tabaci TaxID=7038 RepID=UPI003B27E3FB